MKVNSKTMMRLLQNVMVYTLSVCCGSMMAEAFIMTPPIHQTASAQYRIHQFRRHLPSASSSGEPTIYHFDEATTHNGGDDDVLYIENIDNLQFDAPCAVFEHGVVIRNCTVTLLQLHAAYFTKGFQILNSTILCKVDWFAGGHNEKGPIVFQDVVFIEFADLGDCWFHDVLRIERVKFLKGTNLLEGHVDNQGGGTYNPFCVTFDVDPVLIDVEGELAKDSNFTITGPIGFYRTLEGLRQEKETSS